jgi:hypothetical protein
MNELIHWIARKRFEADRKRAHKAWLLAEATKARETRLIAEAG